MDVLYARDGIEFEWDANKAAINMRKHGVAFEEATEVFQDPMRLLGDASVDDETRYHLIGYSYTLRLLLVIYVQRGERTRLISARTATGAERRHYENG